MRLFLHTAYDGTAYHGWQVQPNAQTVQAVLEARLATLLGQPVPVVGSGRTDAGVHAETQWVHLDWPPELPPPPADLAYRLNCLLPPDIAVKQVCTPADDSLHARFSAVARSYRYSIARVKSPLWRHMSLLYTAELDAEKMQEATAILLRYNDFACFCKTGGDQQTTLCRISRAEWVLTPERWDFHITADRFLRGMVRAIVGTLLEVGKGKRTVESVEALILSGDRKLAGMAAPAQGLSLYEVTYPPDSLLPYPLPG
ncbi:MAG: tRNA pseudouridine(38-40) synthase TruA [Bacteroidetes bacterium]|nr:tRNA pseudouridine(38-40) synthase TruA [Bacteroidota bacterium]